MMFLKPEYLYMMLIPTFILFFFIVTNKSATDSFFDEKVLEKLRFDNDSLGRVGRNILIFVALIMMIISLARPVLPKADVSVKTKSIDMLVALDVSKSMMATDRYPNRLAFAKKRFKEFVDSFSEANIGVIAFSSEGFLVSPMTKDSTTLKYLVDNLSLDSMSLKGTNLLIPIAKAAEFLKDSKDKILIIFTDGGDGSDFSKEIALAKEKNESIYIYGVASKEGAPIKDGGKAITDKSGNIVISRLNESIKELAFKSGGAYIVANYKDNSVKLMVEDIKKKFKATDVKTKDIKEYKELFYYPLSVAVFLFLFLFHSFPKKGVVLLLLVWIDPKVEAKVFDFFDIQKADEAYKSKDYKEALKHYKEVAKSNKSPSSVYDLANAYYKSKDYKQALKAYGNVTTTDDALKYKKHFNTANSHFKLKEYEKAIKEYEEAKKIKVEDDLTHNLELAKKMLKKKQDKKKKKNKDKKKDKDKKKNKDKDKDKKSSDKDGDKKDKKDKKKEGDKDKKKKNQKPKQDEKKENSKMKQDEKVSKKEEKMWQEHLESMKPKTMPLRLKTDRVKRRADEKPW
jgi:Ca-activated chloride channel family protein